MSVSWTKEQKKVIDLRNRNLLVSAAAGSGKTAVLVERIINRITEKSHPVDIDRLLIVTFTNAAAAEMRERIGAAIEKALSCAPENEHLQRQLTLVHNAQITTIDSFCLYVIRNHFHEIDLEPNFRIGDEGELRLLKEDVLRKVLEENYEEGAPGFLALVEGYSPGRSDAALHEMILSLYEFSQSYPWPEEWLKMCRRGYGVDDEAGINECFWIQPLTETIRYVVCDLAGLARQALALTCDEDGPQMYERAIRSDLEKYIQIAQCEHFTDFWKALNGLTYDRLPSSRGFDGDKEKLEKVKALRDKAKDVVKKLKCQYFFCSPATMAEQLRRTEPMAAELARLASSFAAAFAAEKRRKNLVDFGDLEHFALEILVDRETKEARRTAEEFKDAYEEIMIDEYQDSNYVQETILRAVSRETRGKNNIFMVGDVKQSIYRFRLARPELFMEKYDTYTTDDSDRQRIDLHKNFRSREEVLSFINDIFYKIMAKDLGNVAYDSEAALYPGAVYPLPEDQGDKEMFEPEVLLFDNHDDLLADLETAAFHPESLDKKQMEARMTAGRIAELLKSQFVTDRETGKLRRIRCCDIVILLRSLSGWADTFAAVLNDAGIPAHTVSATGYFSAVEVQTVLAMLRILDNPRQDIPLAAVLRSPVAGLTDEELALLKLSGGEADFHAGVLLRCEEVCGETKRAPGGSEGETETGTEAETALDRKLRRFYRLYLKLRALVPDTPIHELIEVLLKETGYGDYAAAMPAGARRRANLRMLVEKAIAYENTSYKGLFHFVRYIDKLQKYDVDFGEADLTGENEDVVRIMSIHKSKGLEFPVVFVCGLGKHFNRRDVQSRMVLHPELGMGLDCMDGERRVKSPTIVKKAVAKQTELENLGEELRVLYVALTRAKEKLILTGGMKDAAEALETIRETALAKGAQREEKTLSYLEREGASGYLDWILPALCAYGGRYKIRVTGVAELAASEMEKQIGSVFDREACMEQIRGADAGLKEALDRRFSFCYPNRSDLLRKNKYSVSELKHRAMREHFEREQEENVPLFVREEIVPYIPPFARRQEEEKEESGRGALRGTAMHRVMECCEFNAGVSVEMQIEQMLADGKITQEAKELVKVPLVEAFFASAAGVRMKKAEAAGRLFKEKPFVMGFTAEELAAFGFDEPGEQKEEMRQTVSPARGADVHNDEAGEDLTLIQGIIDVFWVEEDGIVVLDYKTDRVKNAAELAARYAAQLHLYAEALERICNRDGERRVRVKERLLYSFRLGEIIAV